jgi:hypothetical protein
VDGLYVGQKNLVNHFIECRSLHFGLTPDAATFADRVEAACEIVERELPYAAIDFTMPYNRSDASGPHKVDNRHKYLRQRPRTKLWWFVLNDGKGWPETVSIMGRIDDQDLGTLGVEIMFPAAPWDFCERLMVELGDVLGANYSAVLPPEALGLCATQFNTYWAPHDPTLIERGIPRLDLFTYGGADDIVQPMYLGWLNYWSEATCAFVGFSGSKEDLELAPSSYQTPGGAWLVKLTDEPIDICCPEHMAALAAAYRRWPRVGKRMGAERSPKNSNGQQAAP